jgi:hypothetical protein
MAEFQVHLSASGAQRRTQYVLNMALCVFSRMPWMKLDAQLHNIPILQKVLKADFGMSARSA